MFALAQRNEMWFPALGRGHGSKRRMPKDESGKLLMALDCSNRECRTKLESKGLFAQGHSVGQGANYDQFIDEHSFGERVKQ